MKPEDIIFKEWRNFAKLALNAETEVKRQGYRALTDSTQYLLESFSAYGKKLVRHS